MILASHRYYLHFWRILISVQKENISPKISDFSRKIRLFKNEPVPSAHSHLGWQTVVHPWWSVSQWSPWQHLVSPHSDPHSFHCSFSPHSGAGHSSRHQEWPVFGSKMFFSQLIKRIIGKLTGVSRKTRFTSANVLDGTWRDTFVNNFSVFFNTGARISPCIAEHWSIVDTVVFAVTFVDDN